MAGDEGLHRIRILAVRRQLQFIEPFWCRDREDRRIDHRGAPDLAVRRRQLKAEAPNTHGKVGRIGVGRSEVEPA